jgi:hypothetical protein
MWMEKLRQRVKVMECAMDLLAAQCGIRPRDWEEILIKAQARASLDEIHELQADLPKTKEVELKMENPTEVLTSLIKNISGNDPR